MISVKQAIPTYGYDLLKTIDRDYFRDCIVICAPEPWEFVKSEFAKAPHEVIVPKSMEQSVLEKQLSTMPKVSTVFGIGGGSACDAAKMYGWLYGARVVLIPTILSVDAPFTKAIGVRIGHRVRYIGEVYPEHLLIDFNLLQKATPKLNRAGIGDILSIYTALFDWRLAAEKIGEEYDQNIAAQSQALLDRLLRHSKEIRDCTEEGLKLIAELYKGEVALCELFGNSRPEEGSEHYLAYCLEYLTHKTYLHGELVSLAVLLIALYQSQPVEWLMHMLNEMQVEYRPELVGVSLEELKQALLHLPAYLAEEKQLLFGIFHHKGMDSDQAIKLIAELDSLLK